MTDNSDIFEDRRGEDLAKDSNTVNATFSNHICVSEVSVQKTALNRKDSNVVQFEVSYTTPNGSDVLTPDGKKLVSRSGENSTTILEPTMLCNVQGIQFKILKTSDGNPPVYLRLIVMGCYAPSKLFLIKKLYSNLFYLIFLVDVVFVTTTPKPTRPSKPTGCKIFTFINIK